MAARELSLEVKLTAIDCGECGGTYAINERYRKQQYDHAGTWHCPYCRTGWGFEETEADRLKKEIANQEQRRRWAEERATAARAEAEHQAARAAGFKGALTKTKKRVAAGVCPCCNRSFENLRRHMDTKHPDYDEPIESATTAGAHCGAETATGGRCSRIGYSDRRCWQHRKAAG